MDLMTIYNHSPIWLQNIFTSIEGYKYKRKRHNKHYRRVLKELMHRNYQDEESLIVLRNRSIVEIINYAYNYSDFYNDFYRGIDLSTIKSPSDLQKLPVLEKEIVRKNINRFYTIPSKQGVVSNTSGTTGTPIKFIYRQDDLQFRMAYLDFYKISHGFIPIKMRRASFNSAKIVPPKQKSKIFWRTNYSIKQRIYSGYHCQGDNIPYYVENLKKYKPQSLDGYPSSLFQISKYINQNNIDLGFTPIAIFPTAETLLPHYKTEIEKAFKCKIFDQYASSEGAPFITTCDHGNLHYCYDTGIIEVDETGEMMVTCFHTHGTPLIRYKIGDKIIFDETETKCSCGSFFPLVKSIEGRNHDYLVSKTNGKFPALYLSLVSQSFNNSIKAMQFRQDSLDEIVVLLETDEKYSPDMNRIILDKLHYSFGEDMTITIKVVSAIEKDASGKVKFIINNLDR